MNNEAPTAPHTKSMTGMSKGVLCGLHHAMSDTEKQGEAKKPVGCCLGGEYAQEFTKDKEGFGNGFGNDRQYGFVFDLRGKDTRSNKSRESHRKNIDGAHSVSNHEDVVVFHGVAGYRGVNDEAKKANQNNDHKDRLSDTLREGVPCDSE